MPIIPIAAAVVSSLAGAAANSFFGRKAADRSYEQAQETWRKQNEYNTPANQVNRLKMGGLNPALMYGAGSGANTAGQLSSVPQNKGISSHTPNFYLESLAAKKAESEIENIKAQTRNLDEKTVTEKYSQRFVDSQIVLNQSRNISEQQKARLASIQADLEADSYQMSVEQRRLANAKLSSEISNLQHTALSLSNKNSLFPHERQALVESIQQMAAKSALLQVQEKATRAGIALTDAQVRKADELIKLITLEQVTEEFSGYEQMSRSMAAKSHAEMAEKANAWYHADKVKGYVESISSQALGWVSKGLNSGGYNKSREYYDDEGTFKGKYIESYEKTR